MKGRESGMPEKKIWGGPFNPERILETMNLDRRVENVAEFGCGYGTFTIPAARIAKGIVYAIDIESEMADATEKEAKQQGVQNVKTIRRDFMVEGIGLLRRKRRSCDDF